MHPDIKSLLEKYVRQECTPEEIKEIVRFFQQTNGFDPEILPSGEEVLKMLDQKQHVDEKSAARIYQNIMTCSRKVESKRFSLRNSTRAFAAAAILVVLLGSSFLLKQYFVQEATSLNAQGEYVTIELENGQKKILKMDSLKIADELGHVVGVQKGERLVYASEEEITSLRYNTINVPYGKRFELSLSDGSRVYLNAGTSIKFPIGFVKGMKREVFLTGEAFFDVAKDKKHPFIVNTGSLAVEVLGTEFNVEAYGENITQKIVLVEGSVKVNNNNGEEMLMAPNQMVSSRNGLMTRSAVTASEFTSWKEGYFTLKRTSMKETITLLERYYHIKIYSRGQEDLNQTVGGKIYLSDDVENVITTLSLLTRNQYTFEHVSATKTKN
ncbi:MAG: FecR domain-containing protein [Salinimicrobium sp.]